MKEKEKESKNSVTPAPTTPEIKPKKRHGCLIAAVIVGAMLVFILVASWFLPFIGVFWGGSDSGTPVLPADSSKDTTADNSNNKQQSTPSDKKSSGSNSSTNSSAYSKEDYINYFLQVSTRNGIDTLGRFTKSPVYLKVEGNIPAGSEDMLNDVIADFNGLSNSVKIERNQEGSDIQIFYVPRSELDNYRNPQPNDAFEVEIPNADCSYKYAKVYIGYDVMDADTLQYVIRHELTHAIGFKGHILPSTVNSIMANRIKMNDYPTLDQVMIQMLYNMGVPLCANSDGIRSFFAGWNP